MTSKNVPSADNQQERIRRNGWVVGFVDGEGSFLVNIFKSPKAKLGWQVFPEFNVSQAEKAIDALYFLEKFFKCGHIYAHTKRNIEKTNWDPLYKFCVRSKPELKERIIPFFEENLPRTAVKRRDFKKFVKVIKMIDKGDHLNVKGLRAIAKVAQGMTHRKPFEESSVYEFLLSSETIRRGKK